MMLMFALFFIVGGFFSLYDAHDGVALSLMVVIFSLFIFRGYVVLPRAAEASGKEGERWNYLSEVLLSLETFLALSLYPIKVFLDALERF